MRSLGLAALAGAGVMGLEMLASRWLAPAFGFTLGTWSIVISVTLLAGSLGAWIGGGLSRGGRVAPGVPLLLASLGLALDALLAPALDDALLGLPLLAGTAIAATAVLFLPVLALAAVVPLLAARESGARATAGSVVGRLIGASTLGSLVGTLTVALLLVPAVGVRRSALILAAVLAIAGLATLRRRGPRIGAAALLAGIVAVSLMGRGVGPEIHETAYGRLEVVRGEGRIGIRVNGIEQGTVTPDSLVRGGLLRHRQYVELLPWMRPGARTAICVGLGGALHPRCLEGHGIEVETIEIDPVLVDVVRRELGYEGTVRLGDGRVVLRRLGRRVDLLVLDAFRGESLPSHLLTLEAMQEARASLTPGGILCVHLVGHRRHPVTAAVARTLAGVFARVLAVGGDPDDDLTDLFLFASDGPLVVPPHPELAAMGWLGNETFDPDVSEASVLTDDRPRLDGLAEPLARELRRRSRGR